MNPRYLPVHHLDFLSATLSYLTFVGVDDGDELTFGCGFRMMPPTCHVQHLVE